MSEGTKNSNQLKGLKLRTITIMLIVVLLALCGIFIVNIIHIKNGYEMLASAYERSVQYRHDAQMVREGSYYLTEEVHMYVVTGDKKYADLYFVEVNETQRRTKAVEDLRKNTIMTSSEESLVEALKESNRLKEREVYAIRLVAEAVAVENGWDVDTYIATFDKAVADCDLSTTEKVLDAAGKRAAARDIVFSDDYLEFRNKIDTNIQHFLDATYEMTANNKDAALQKMRSSLTQQSIFIVLVLLLTAVYSICISRLVLKPLKIYMKCVREGRTFELLGAYEFKHLALTYNNIFEVQHENEKMLRQNAEHDPLTGLLNRGAYNRAAAQYLDREVNIAAMIIDIDSFKTINDTYGHDVGDDVIRSVGQLLLNSFRPSDIVARIGGDEFMIIMLDVTIESAENLEVKINTLNEALQRPTSDLPKTSLSVGVAFSEYGYSDEVFKRADIALYQTKQKGKKGVSFNNDVVTKSESAAENVQHNTPHRRRKDR